MCKNLPMGTVQHLPFRRFTVTVTHADGMWIGVCDELSTATEAPTYETLMERFWQIGPEMALENGLNVAVANMHLQFVHEVTAPELLAL